MTGKHPWDRLAKETDKAFAAFCVYRDMGAGRSHTKTATALGKAKGYRGWLETWSSRFDWVARAAKYDAHLDGKAQEATVEEYQELAKLQVRIASKGLRLVEALFDQHQRFLEQEGELDMTTTEATRLLRETAKIVQVVHERPTEITEERVKVYTPRRVSIDAGEE